MLPGMFRYIWPTSFRGEEFLNQPIRKKNRLWWPCLLMDRDGMRNLYKGPSIDASSTSTSTLVICKESSDSSQECIILDVIHHGFLPSFGSFGQTVTEEKKF
jgi:hypothetical protein